MPKLDRYLLSDFTQSFLATLIVLLVVSVGGVMVNILGDIASGSVPARLLFSQVGLQFISYLPLILPLALLLGLMLAFSRLYRDSEMAVITAMGVGPVRMLRPLAGLVVPVVAVVALCSLWLGPLAQRVSSRMIDDANRNMVVTGLDAGHFTALNDGGVVYVADMSADGATLGHVFMQRQKDGRLDVVTSKSGLLYFEGDRQRFLKLQDGFRVEGPLNDTDLDFRLMRFAANEVALPDRKAAGDDDPELKTTSELLHASDAPSKAQLHSRLASPLIALALALLTLPLSRASPRQQRYGRIMLGFLVYLAAINLMILGNRLIATGKLSPDLGLWWLTLPLLAAAVWMYLRDGRLGRSA